MLLYLFLHKLIAKKTTVTYPISRVQLLENSLARAVTGIHKTEHITPVLKSMHWLNIEERIHYKIIALTYDLFRTNQP